MGETVQCPCQLVYLYQAVPPAPVPWDLPDNTAKLPRTLHVTQTTPAPTEVSAPCSPSTSTSASAPEDGQDRDVNMRTAVCLVPVPTVESAAVCPLVATYVPVLQATQVLDALMTQMNVPPHPPYARMEENASTPLAPTCVPVPQDLQADTVKAHISRALLHHA